MTDFDGEVYGEIAALRAQLQAAQEDAKEGVREVRRLVQVKADLTAQLQAAQEDLAAYMQQHGADVIQLSREIERLRGENRKAADLLRNARPDFGDPALAQAWGRDRRRFMDAAALTPEGTQDD